MLLGRGVKAFDSRVALRTPRRSKATGYLKLGLPETQVAFAQIIGEGYLDVTTKGQDSLLPFFEAVAQVAPLSPLGSASLTLPGGGSS